MAGSRIPDTRDASSERRRLLAFRRHGERHRSIPPSPAVPSPRSGVGRMPSIGDDQALQPCSRSKHSMISEQVRLRWGDERDQRLDQLGGLEHDAPRAIPPRLAEHVDELAIESPVESLVRQWRPSDVATQSLERLAISRRDGDVRVQRELVEGGSGQKRRPHRSPCRHRRAGQYGSGRWFQPQRQKSARCREVGIRAHGLASRPLRAHPAGAGPRAPDSRTSGRPRDRTPRPAAAPPRPPASYRSRCPPAGARQSSGPPHRRP